MNYTALTIGPIHKTLQSVKSTKAIWVASYMFSYLMKEIIKRIENKDSIILPYSGKVEINNKPFDPLDENYKPGTGLFPDRIIVEGNIDLQSIIDETINAFSQKVIKDLKEKIDPKEKPELKQVDESKLIEYLKNYINCYYLTVEIGEKDNAILKINELLDSLELQQRVLKKADNDYLRTFFEDVYYNFLIENEFDGDEKRFPSTIEIAKSEYKDIDGKKFRYIVNTLFEKQKNKEKDSIDTQKLFIEKIKNEDLFKNTVRNYQKYIAVVQADGDNIGTFIKFLYEQDNKNELIERFSKNLLSFAIEAVKLITTYKGTPIYAGGDDLLFFAPVAHTQYNSENKTVSINKTILTLIKQLDNKFDEFFKKDAEFGKLMNDQEAKKNLRRREKNSKNLQCHTAFQ